MLQRGLFCAAAGVMVCAIGAAVLQSAVLILGMSSPVAITVITLVALVGLNSLLVDEYAPPPGTDSARVHPHWHLPLNQHKLPGQAVRRTGRKAGR